MSDRFVPGALSLAVLLAACDETQAPPRPAVETRTSPVASPSVTPPLPPPSSPPPARRLRFPERATPVVSEPSRTSMEIGRVEPGGFVEQTGDARAPSADCPGGFLPVLPIGFVCDGHDLRVAGESERVSFLVQHAAPPRSPYPASYGESLGTVAYDAVPSVLAQQKSEPALDAQRSILKAARRAALLGKDDEIPPGLRGVDLTTPADACPSFLETPADATVRERLPRGVEVAWIAECEAQERTWLVSPGLELIPRDRVARVVASALHGVPDPAPPTGPRAAFVTGRSRPRYRMARYGYFEQLEAPLPVQSIVWLTGQSKTVGQYTYLETTSEGEHVLADHVAAVEPVTRPRGVGASERWIDVQASKGLLVAYAGDSPVYAALCAAPPPQVDDGVARLPARGRFRVEWKHRTQTLGEGTHVRRDLPHAQSLGGRLVLVGDPSQPVLGATSGGGSIRVSPVDAAWLFAFTQPAVPEGWSARRGEGASPGTWLQIRD